MSDRKPLTTAIRDFARHARNIKSMTDPDAISVHVDRRLRQEGYWTKRNLLFARLAYVAAFSVLRSKHRAPGDERQLHLWNDLDQPFNIHSVALDEKTGKPAVTVEQKELGDFTLSDIESVTTQKDSNIKAATTEFGIWNRAVSFVKPLLASNPDWVWRDAVEYMKQNGGLPDIEAA